MIARLVNVRRNEEGAIALMTLFFMVFAGLALLLLLWGIARATGAFNALYAANQSAALAAATAAKGGEAAAGNGQIAFDCGARPADPTDCISGGAFHAADSVMRASLGPGAPGTFGLQYTTVQSQPGTNVWLVDERGQRLGHGLVQAYEVGYQAGIARNLADQCTPGTLEDEAYVNGILGCWRVREFGRAFPKQFQSGIISRARAELELYPGCQGANWCPTVDMMVTSAATQAQPTPVSDYGDYYCYGENRQTGCAP